MTRGSVSAAAAEGDHEDEDDGADDWVAGSIPLVLLVGFLILALAVRRKG